MKITNFIVMETGLIAFIDSALIYFVIKDNLGSTRVLFRSTGTQYTTYDYSPFGSLMRATINGDVVHKFTGQEFDSETGYVNGVYQLGINSSYEIFHRNFVPFENYRFPFGIWRFGR